MSDSVESWVEEGEYIVSAEAVRRLECEEEK